MMQRRRDKWRREVLYKHCIKPYITLYQKRNSELRDPQLQLGKANGHSIESIANRIHHGV